MVHPVAPTMWMDWYRAMLGLKGGEREDDERGEGRKGRGEELGETRGTCLPWHREGSRRCRLAPNGGCENAGPTSSIASERRKVGPGQLTW